MYYDIFKHGTNCRVFDPKSGRHGEVVEIQETSYEYIEPFVKWDDTQNVERFSGTLVLEEK